VPLKELNVSRLSLLLDHVLNDPIYRDNARYIQEAIAKTDGLSKAADLLERAFGFLKSSGSGQFGRRNPGSSDNQ
jgi:UDP:flavonoid glycosyltransferase YjiC (YdhE family)